VNGFLAARSIRVVFFGGVVVLGLLAVLVRRVMVERQPIAAPTPTVEEA
jgi:hypothetical protein